MQPETFVMSPAMGEAPLAGVEPAVPTDDLGSLVVSPFAHPPAHLTQHPQQQQQQMLSYAQLLECLNVLECAAHDEHQRRRGQDDVSPFHSLTVPPISLVRFADHIVTRCGYGADGIACGIALTARYCAVAKTPLTALMVHRLFLTCIQVGMKSCDIFVKNKYFAQVSGVDLRHLNAHEVHLLDALDFRAVPSRREFVDLPRALLAVSTNQAFLSRPVYQLMQQFAKSLTAVSEESTMPATPTPRVSRSLSMASLWDGPLQQQQQQQASMMMMLTSSSASSQRQGASPSAWPAEPSTHSLQYAASQEASPAMTPLF